eukprot:6179178-Pleurochrysis_carterae.AAC.1
MACGVPARAERSAGMNSTMRRAQWKDSSAWRNESDPRPYESTTRHAHASGDAHLLFSMPSPCSAGAADSPECMREYPPQDSELEYVLRDGVYAERRIEKLLVQLEHADRNEHRD